MRIPKEENYAFAYLPASADTTIAAVATWYPIQGTLANTFSNFSLSTNAIQCDAANSNLYEIDWHIKGASDTVSATMNVTVKINDTVYETSKMGAFAKTAGEPISFGGTEMVQLESGDTVQLVIQSDKAGGVITVGQCVATITKFVLKRQ